MRKKKNKIKSLNNSIEDYKKERITTEIKELEDKLKESIINQKNTEEKRAVEAIKKNAKYFYSYANKKLKKRVDIEPLENEGVLITDSKEMAELLKIQYEKVFSTPKIDALIKEPEQHFKNNNDETQYLTDIDFNEIDIIEAI